MPGTWQQELDQAVDARFAQIVALRRHLHAHPELSGQEQATSLHLYQMLGNEGFDVRMGPEGRGVIADTRLASGDAGCSRIALRADIDALRIRDRKTVDYRSRHEGVMHACGHDAHTALVCGAIFAIGDLCAAGTLPWPVKVRGIFQPAEETCEGARQMIAVGALENVAGILATHVDPSRQVGHIGLRAGVLTANCDEVQVRILGRGGHAARPHEASDPIAAAAQLINALYLFIPRATDSQDAVVVTVGQIYGGDNANVIPEEVLLRGTLRTLDRAIRQRTFEHIRRLADGIGKTSDTRIEVTFARGAASVCNDTALIELLRNAGRDVVGETGLDEIRRPSMGSEDFAFYLEQVPGAMIRLGCASALAGGSPLHTPTFDVDEEALRIGAKILARAAVCWSQPPDVIPADRQPTTAASRGSSIQGDFSVG
jgi:amidohydrolase